MSRGTLEKNWNKNLWQFWWYLKNTIKISKFKKFQCVFEYFWNHLSGEGWAGWGPEEWGWGSDIFVAAISKVYSRGRLVQWESVRFVKFRPRGPWFDTRRRTTFQLRIYFAMKDWRKFQYKWTRDTHATSISESCSGKNLTLYERERSLNKLVQ